MSNEHSEPDHGDSPAAWTAVVVMLVGLSISTAAFFIDSTYEAGILWLVWTGAGIAILGLVLGFVLSRLGYGVKGPRYVPKTRHD